MTSDQQKVGVIARVPTIDLLLACQLLGCSHCVVESPRHPVFRVVDDVDRVPIGTRASLGDQDVAGAWAVHVAITLRLLQGQDADRD